MKAIAIAALACASWAGAAEPAAKTFPAAGLTTLSVETAGGGIVVEAGGDRVEVTVKDNDPKLCAVTMEPKGGVLTLKAEDKSRSWWRRKGCEASFKVKAPAGLRVNADAGAGDIRVAGIRGALSLGTGAGSIALDGVFGEIRARTGAGDVTGALSSGRAEISTGAGSIELAWKGSPAQGLVKASAGTGSVRLAFPEGTKLDAELSAGIGSTSNAFGDAKGAGLRVTAASGIGSVTLSKEAKGS